MAYIRGRDRAAALPGASSNSASRIRLRKQMVFIYICKLGYILVPALSMGIALFWLHLAPFCPVSAAILYCKAISRKPP